MIFFAYYFGGDHQEFRPEFDPPSARAKVTRKANSSVQILTFGKGKIQRGTRSRKGRVFAKNLAEEGFCRCGRNLVTKNARSG